MSDIGDQPRPTTTTEHRPSLSRPQVEIRRESPPVIVRSDEASASAPSRTLAVVLGAGLVLALLATLALVWVAGDDTATTDGGPAAPVKPAPLTIEVVAPATVVAGQPATFRLRWADGTGIFAGTTEEWGDEVGASSVAVGECKPSAPAAPPASGVASMTHTWATPGSYEVRLAATTYTCRGGKPVVEETDTTLTVEVTAP